MKKNIIANVIGRFWGLFSNFLFVPLYIKFLDFESYAIISYTLVLAGVLAVLDGGLTATLSREFSRRDKDEKEKISTYETLEILYFAITLIGVLLIFVFSTTIADTLTVKNFSGAQIALFLKIVGFDLGFQLLFRFYMGGLLGINKQVLGNAVQICWAITRNAMVLIVIIFNPSLELFFLWQAVSTILFTVIIKYIFDGIVYKKPSFKLFSLRFNVKSFNMIKGFAGGIFLISLISVISSQTDKILISKMMNLETLGYYTLAISVSSVLMVVVSPISTAVLPQITENYSLKEYSRAKALFNTYSRYISILVIALLINIIFFSKAIIWIWTGDLKLVENSYKFVPIIATGYAFIVLQTMCYQVALANGYTKLNTYIGIAITVFLIPGYFVASKFWGAIGICVTFLIIQIINYFVYVYFINKKFIQEAFIKNLIYKQLLLPAIISLPIVVVFSSFTYLINDSRFFTMILLGFSIITSLMLLTLVIIPKLEREAEYSQIKNKLRSILNKNK